MYRLIFHTHNIFLNAVCRDVMKKCEYWKKSWNSPPFLNVPDHNRRLHLNGLSCLNPGGNNRFTSLRYPLYKGCQKSCGTCKEKRDTKGSNFFQRWCGRTALIIQKNIIQYVIFCSCSYRLWTARNWTRM